MAYFDTTWYVNFGDGATTGYYAVAKRPQNAAVAAGQIVRQFTASSVGNERCFICRTAGTTANTTDATWSLSRGVNTNDGTAVWQECTGQASINGDAANVITWAQLKATGLASLGAIIKRNNGASYQFCTTSSGTLGASEPAFSDTAGVTTSEGTTIWVSLGPVGNFTGGQAPHARLGNALASGWFVSGNTVYVGDNHAETQTTVNTLSPSSALLAKILCHNHSGSYPPAASDITTGATITVTSSANFNFTGQGSFYFYGITFVSAGSIILGASSVGQVQNWYYFDGCSIQSTGAAGAFFTVGAQSTAWGIIIWNNTTVKFAGTTSNIQSYFAQFLWQNTGQILVSGSSIPATLFLLGSSGRFSNITLNNLDLSQLTGSLFSNASNSSIGTLIVQDCKLNASMTVTTPINTGMNVQLIRSDSAGTSYKSTRYAYEGTETTETSIVRTGGAVDPTGQAQSRKIVTSANAQWLRPFKAEPMVIWNAVTGANVTATVYGTVNAGVLPNNDDLFMEVEYLASATDPLGKIVTTTKSSVLASNAAVSADGSVWGSPGATTWDITTVSNTIFSNGNLTTTSTASSGGARVSDVWASTIGKFYFEVIFVAIVSDLSHGFGIGTPASAYNTMGASATTGVEVYNSGSIWANGGNTGVSLGTRASGDVIGIAVDLDNRQIWFKKVSGTPGNWNNSGTANPATNVGGIAIPAGAMVPFTNHAATAGSVDTANFGASSFTGAVPSGFNSGWVFAPNPFKLTATLSSPQPQLAGYLHARVRAAKASATYYIDPKVELVIAAPPFTPASLTGLVGWWDASVTASMSLTGANINSVADQSGGGNALSWTGFGKPIYSATGFNSKPAFMFDGKNIGNAFTNTSFPLGTGNTLTCWYVGNFDTSKVWAGSAGIISYTGAGQTADYNNTNSFVLYSPSNSSIQLGFSRTSGMTINCTANANHRVIVTVDSSGMTTFYIDGVAGTPTLTAAGNWTSPGTLNIARSKSGDYWAGPVGEFGIATSYSDATTAANLDTYLKNKWGL